MLTLWGPTFSDRPFEILEPSAYTIVLNMKINLNVFEIILITNLTEKGPKSVNAFGGIALTKENDPGRLRTGRSGFQKPVEENQSSIKSAQILI